MESDNHNPRVDPQIGDRLRLKNKTRIVIKRNENLILYVIEEQPKNIKRACWITTWQDWCKKPGVEIV